MKEVIKHTINMNRSSRDIICDFTPLPNKDIEIHIKEVYEVYKEFIEGATDRRLIIINATFIGFKGNSHFTMKYLRFENCTFKSCRIDPQLMYCEFDHCDFINTEFNYEGIGRSKFNCCSFKGDFFNQCKDITNSEFIKCKFVEVCFCTIKDVDFDHCMFIESVFTHNNIEDVDFVRCILMGVLFDKSYLYQVRFFIDKDVIFDARLYSCYGLRNVYVNGIEIVYIMAYNMYTVLIPDLGVAQSNLFDSVTDNGNSVYNTRNIDYASFESECEAIYTRDDFKRRTISRSDIISPDVIVPGIQHLFNSVMDRKKTIDANIRITEERDNIYGRIK